MKQISVFFLWLFFSVSAFAAAQYSITYGGPGSNGSINVLSDLSSFSFTTDFGSIGGSASIGYYTYTDNINNVTYGTQTFGKKDGETVDLGAFVEGQHIGFYLERNNGQKVTDFFFKEQNGILTLTFNKNGGHGGDETIALAGITAITDSAPSGQPLPGVLAALLIGGATFGVLRLRRKYSKA